MLPTAGRDKDTHYGDVVDTLGASEAEYTINLGAFPAQWKLNAKVQESADGATDWTDITGAAIEELDGADDDAVVSIAVRVSGRAAGSRRRYQRLVLVISGVLSGTAEVGATVDLFKPDGAPVANTPASVLV